MNRTAFTLVELLVTIVIIGILGTVLLGALFQANELSRESRTRSMIARLDQAITTRWESYRTRRLPINPGSLVQTNGMVQSTIADWVANRSMTRDPLAEPYLSPYRPNGMHIAAARLLALRELQRLELPQRWEDVTVEPLILLRAGGTPIRPAISRSYIIRYNNNANPLTGEAAAPSVNFQSAECLYLIITMGGLEEEATALDRLRHADVADTDQDGVPEFVDGWGHPISFLRWAPGFVSDLQPDADLAMPGIQRHAGNNHDPFDQLKLDSSAADDRGYALRPLVFSPGSDNQYDLWQNSARVAALVALHDPYTATSPDPLPGTPYDSHNDSLGHLDNIHSHAIASRTR